MPRLVSDFQKAHRAETSATLLSLFNEIRTTLFQDLLLYARPDFITSILSKARSMAWKHVTFPPPRKFRFRRLVMSARKLMAAVYLEHGSTSKLQEPQS